MKHTIPDWAKKHQQEGTQVVKIKEGYYLYKISSKWDKEKKRARKVTEKYLGKVTTEGIIKPKYERVTDESSLANITIKEYGATRLLDYLCSNIKENLANVYKEDWESIFSFSALRFSESSPIKNLEHHYSHSHLSDLYPNARLIPRKVTELLERIGSDRQKMVDFMRTQLKCSENLIIDLTHIFSSSENITFLSKGYNAEHLYHDQFNMLLLFSKDNNMPVFFRVLDGAVKDVSSIKATIQESGVKNAVFVGDKGFFSENNEEAFDVNEIDHILPLRRNSALINYEASKSQSKKGYDSFFFFNDRHIWYKVSTIDKKRIILFYDEKLKIDESRSFLLRVKKQELLIEEYHEKEHTFGTIAVSVSTDDLTPEEVYNYLKARLNIEIAFDTFKNILEADKTYMQNNTKLYGWMFINFIALQMYYSVYGVLTKHKLIERFSPKDVILHFSKVYKVILLDKEVISEIPKTTRVLLQKMKLPDSILLK